MGKIDYEEALIMYENGYSYDDIAKRFSVHRRSAYEAVKLEKQYVKDMEDNKELWYACVHAYPDDERQSRRFFTKILNGTRARWLDWRTVDLRLVERFKHFGPVSVTILRNAQKRLL